MRQLDYKRLLAKILFFVFSLQMISTSCFADDDILLMKTENEEEAFIVRRIVEFWKDGDYEIVKTQIVEFLKNNPNSHLIDHLKGILADLHLNERNFKQALAYYGEIQNEEVYHKIFINKLQCLYELGQYPRLSHEASSYLESNAIPADREDEFYFLLAEALFNQGYQEEDQSEKQHLCNLAKNHYQKLLDSPYREISLFALAEIHHVLEEYERSAAIYLELAEKYPDQREELLFHAASMQAQYDEYSAIDNFSKVKALKGDHEQKAEYNLLALYFQTKQFSSFLEEASSANVPEDQMDMFNYMLGKSFYMTDDFANAKTPLQRYIDSQEGLSDYLKNALLIQMTCAHKLDDETLFKASLENFQTRYPEDNELPKALFMHAMMCKSMNNLDLVKEELSMILEKFPQFEEQESLLFEYALVAHEKKDWDDSYTNFKTFLEKYPNSKHANIAWKYYLSSCFQLQAAPEQSTINYSKEDFAQDIELVINIDGVLSEDELRDYRMLHGKTLYIIERYNDSMGTFESYVEDYESDAEAYYYIALNHYQLGSSPSSFYANMEKALDLDPELKNDEAVQLQLFNAYLTHLTHMPDGEDKNKLTDKAAEHLYEAYKLPDTQLRLENQLWLANYYYDQFKKGSEQFDKETLYERSRDLFTTALLVDDGNLRSIEDSNLFLEGEVLKLSELLRNKKEHSQSLALLQRLVEEQTKYSQLDWKFQYQALLDLAKNYEILNQNEKALETYAFLLSICEKKDDVIYDEASLNHSKLQFAFLEKNQQNLSNPVVVGILNHLKDLQIKKHVETEPLHLEAALEYATIRHNLANAEERNERYIFFLNRVKEDFETRNDPLSIAYHKSLESMPEKALQYHSYLKYIDAEILRMRAKLEAGFNNNLEAEEYNERSLALLAELKQKNINPELEMRVERCIEKINQFNSYD